jgi:hypothetical protein
MAGPSTPIKLKSKRDTGEERFFNGVPGAPNGKLRAREREGVLSERQAKIKSVAKKLSFHKDDRPQVDTAIEADTSQPAKRRSIPIKGDDDCVFFGPALRLPSKQNAPSSTPPMKRCHSSSTSMDDLISKRARTMILQSDKIGPSLPPSAFLRCKTSLGRSQSACPPTSRSRFEISSTAITGGQMISIMRLE